MLRVIPAALLCGIALPSDVGARSAQESCPSQRCEIPDDEVLLIQVKTNLQQPNTTGDVDWQRRLADIKFRATSAWATGVTQKTRDDQCSMDMGVKAKCYAGVPTKEITGDLDDCCFLATEERLPLFNYFDANSTCQLFALYDVNGFMKCNGQSWLPGTKNGNEEPSLYESALLQHHRPPQQTPLQAAAMQKIEATAAPESEDARPWVKDYMGSSAVRSRLDPALQNYSNEELLDAFMWEFEHLAIFHNAPASSEDADDIGTRPIHLMDDSALHISLRNGYLQNPCIRLVVGGIPEHVYNRVAVVEEIMKRRFGVEALDAVHSLRKANNCVTFNANNLRKASAGTFAFGGFTYVLNTNAMKGRLFWEAWDAGMTEMMHRELKPPMYPGLGTHKHFLHLVQPHEEMWNLRAPIDFPLLGIPDTCCNYSLASVLNRWLVPGTPVPTAADSGTIFMQRAPYYEVTALGNVWLPEDLLYGIAQFRDGSGIYGESAGLFGTQLAEDLRRFCIKNKRPLIWSNGLEGEMPMLIDPIVGNVHGVNITEKDKKLFKTWKQTHIHGFKALADATPKYLHFKYQSYRLRHICAEAERDPHKQVMGINGDNNCVYWMQDAETVDTWELLNDGTCVKSSSSRAVYESQTACLAATTSWSCVENISGAAYSEASYCIPSSRGTFRGVDQCEATCGHPKAKPAAAPSPELVASPAEHKTAAAQKQRAQSAAEPSACIGLLAFLAASTNAIGLLGGSP